MKPFNDMTEEELIVQFDDLDPPEFWGLHDEIALALRNKLKEANTPNPDEIHIVWDIEDVYACWSVEHRHKPTLGQAREVLKRLYSCHAQRGVTWSEIEATLTDVMEGR